jgi:hypothetical protein
MLSKSSSADEDCGGFSTACLQLFRCGSILRVFREHGPAKRRPPKIKSWELIMALVFHCLRGSGTLAENTRILTGKRIAESSMSERRQRTPWSVFTAIMEFALRPKAEEQKHPEAFYNGLRLVSMDGTEFSVTNTPQILGSLTKAASRRFKAAFAKVRMVMLVELGVHNPLAAAIGKDGESEMALAKTLIRSLPERCLLLGDRLYGVGVFLALLAQEFKAKGGHYLVRVKKNLKAKVLAAHADGSATVEVKVSTGGRLMLREVRGKVRRAGGQWVEVRFWTSLLDAAKHPAKEMLELYARRWEQEMIYKEMKIDMRQSEIVRSHTVETAAQEIATLVLAHAILAEQRMNIAAKRGCEVLRISFQKTHDWLRSMWTVIALSEGVLSDPQINAIVRQVLDSIAQCALPKRRKRSCPRAVRQPVSSWPRLTKNTYSNGDTEYQLSSVPA